MMDRREFAGLVPALLALGVMGGETAEAQGQQVAGAATGLEPLESGVWKAGPEHMAGPQRMSRPSLKGLLKAGEIQLEMHTTTQEVGAPHEPLGTHKHSEIWLVRSGVVELTTNGVARRMEAGDIGICTAGDEHFVKNVGSVPCTYFVVTVGAPE